MFKGVGYITITKTACLKALDILNISKLHVERRWIYYKYQHYRFMGAGYIKSIKTTGLKALDILTVSELQV